MVDVRTQPLIAEKNAIRVDPYPQPSSDPLSTLPPSVAKSAGASARTPSAADNPDVDGDGQLSQEEIGHLQQAAATGDKEAFDLLNALQLPLGIAAGAAGLYGAVRGGLALTDAVAKSKGMEMVPSGKRKDGKTTFDPARDGMNKVLPQTPLLTDQTGGRFNQPAPQEPLQLPDSRSIYEKSGGKLPTGAAAGSALREAARAARRMH